MTEELEKLPECLHPIHDERADTSTTSRCLCYDCLAQRDSVLGNAIWRMVDVVRRGTLHQIEAQAENLNDALWDTKVYIGSGAEERIRAENWGRHD